MADAHSTRPAWPAWAEKPPRVWMEALPGTASPNRCRVRAPSTRARPGVPRAWKPAIMIRLSRRWKLWHRWRRMRPPLPMPLPAMMIAPPAMRWIAIESSGVARRREA